MSDLQRKTDMLLEHLLYCDLRTNVGVDKAKIFIRQALRDAAANKTPLEALKAKFEADGILVNSPPKENNDEGA